MSRNELYNELKEARREQLFWREFDKEVANQIAMKKEGKVESDGYHPDKCKYIKPYQRPEAFTVENDDKHHTKLWDSMLKDCAFYFDNPNATDKVATKKKLQFRYDSLFSSSWRAPLNNRHDLLLWACQQRNSYMAENGNEGAEEHCEYQTLLSKYGPDYEPLKDKIGYLRGLFE